MKQATSITAALAALVMASGAASAQSAAEGALMDADGNTIGTVTLTQMAQGVQIVAEASGLPAGVHAFHIHAVGLCEPPFTSAGGHFNPTDVQHGWNNREGHHAGDLPNVHVQDDGVLTVEFFTTAVTLGDGDTGLFDEDGAAIVMHQGPDDYQTDPAGDAGARIACAVISPSM